MIARYLDQSEVELSQLAAPLAVEYRGDVDEELLGLALRLLCRQFPVLCAKVVTDDRGYLIRVISGSYPDFVVLNGDVSSLDAVRSALRIAAEPLDPAHAVAELLLVRGSVGGNVALRLNHAIADARAAIFLFDKLWWIYSQLSNGFDVHIGEGARLPLSPSGLLKYRWSAREASAARSNSPRDYGCHFPALPKPRSYVDGMRSRRLFLTKAETGRLKTVAGTYSISVHGLMFGLVLMALRACGKIGGSEHVNCLSAVDLRDRVDPPVGATEVTSFGVTYGHTCVLASDVSPIGVGRRIKASLDSSIAKREPGVDLAEIANSGHATVTLSNAGSIAKFRTPTTVSIVDFRILRGDLALATRSQPFVGFYGLYSYDGRLTLELPSNITEGELADMFDATLEGIKSICSHCVGKSSRGSD